MSGRPSHAHQVLSQMAGLRRTLRSRRVSSGISQATLAAGLGLSRETVNRRETGGALDLTLVDLLSWVVRLGGELNVTWHVTPADAVAASEWGRVAFPDHDLDGEVLPVVERHTDKASGLKVAVLVWDGAQVTIPAAHVMPADPPEGR